MLDVVRPEKRPTGPSRRALVADAALAIVLTVIALVAAAKFPGSGHILEVRPRLIEPLRLQPPATPSIDVPPPLEILSSPPPAPSPPPASSPRPVPSLSRRAGPQIYEPPLLLVVLTALPVAPVAGGAQVVLFVGRC